MNVENERNSDSEDEISDSLLHHTELLPEHSELALTSENEEENLSFGNVSNSDNIDISNSSNIEHLNVLNDTNSISNRISTMHSFLNRLRHALLYSNEDEPPSSIEIDSEENGDNSFVENNSNINNDPEDLENGSNITNARSPFLNLSRCISSNDEDESSSQVENTNVIQQHNIIDSDGSSSSNDSDSSDNVIEEYRRSISSMRDYFLPYIHQNHNNHENNQNNNDDNQQNNNENNNNPIVLFSVSISIGGTLNSIDSLDANLSSLPLGLISNPFRYESNNIREFISSRLSEILSDTSGPKPTPLNRDKKNSLKKEIINDITLYDDKECYICLEKYNIEEEVINLPCNHIFHSNCILTWFDQGDTCPTCKSKID